jgi:crossover junction endodeoxyribonuclease RuvC
MNKKISIGIDPGLNGAVAAIDEGFNVLALEDTPTVRAKGKILYNITAMCALLRRLALLGDPFVVLEQAQGMPGQGVSSTFSTGYGFGIWSGILGALELPYRSVRPSAWTREVLAGSPGEGKERSIGFVMRMFPGAELVPPGCRKPRDGRADALCLAYWGLSS